MNKIIISKKSIKGNNVIRIDDSGEYLIEYVEDGNYNITFIINNEVKIIESSFDRILDINNKYVIENGSLQVFKFYNNIKVKETINIDLCKEESKIDYHFSNICRECEDYIININHNCKNTYSNIVNKSISLKNSHLKFTINSNVYKDCIKSVLDQNTRIVTMGESDASISPNMFIDLDDVLATHGSVIGTFKEDQVFYLMSKGISYNDTLKLLIKGYLFSNLEVDSDLRLKIMDIIDTYWR